MKGILFIYKSCISFSSFCIIKHIKFIYRLFFGGFIPIIIESIRLVETRQNFESFIASLCCLDNLLSGGHLDRNFWRYNLMDNKNYDKILQNIFEMAKNIDKDNDYDPYLCSTLKCFLENKTNIILNFDALGKNFKRGLPKNVAQLFIYKFRGNQPKPKNSDDVANLFKVELLDMFKNVRSIKMELCRLFFSCTVSLMALLSIIRLFPLDIIILEIAKHGSDICDELNVIYPITTELRKKYKDWNYNINLKYNTGKDNKYIWCIIQRNGPFIEYDAEKRKHQLAEIQKMYQKKYEKKIVPKKVVVDISSSDSSKERSSSDSSYTD